MFKINLAKKINTESGPNELQVKLNIKPGLCTAITGCSGSGKTTLLRMIAGLTKPDRGSIKWESDVWFDSSLGIFLPPQKRAVGFVFQNHALFPHLSVKKNISFACKSEKKVNALIDLAGLGELRDKRPGQLSGGQQQRVALMRSIALNPKILLLDEPLSALDIETRHRLQNLILKIQSEINLTILLVSHDEYEIGKLAKELVLIENNNISVLPILNKRGIYEDSLRLW